MWITAKMAPVTLFWHGTNLDHLICIRHNILCTWSLTFSYSCAKFHKNTQKLWHNRHKYSILAPSQSIFYMHQTSIRWLNTIHNMNKFHPIIFKILYKHTKLIVWEEEIIDIGCILSPRPQPQCTSVWSCKSNYGPAHLPNKLQLTFFIELCIY